MTFTLQSELTINDNGIVEKNVYETILFLNDKCALWKWQWEIANNSTP